MLASPALLYRPRYRCVNSGIRPSSSVSCIPAILTMWALSLLARASSFAVPTAQAARPWAACAACASRSVASGWRGRAASSRSLLSSGQHRPPAGAMSGAVGQGEPATDAQTPAGQARSPSVAETGEFAKSPGPPSAPEVSAKQTASGTKRQAAGDGFGKVEKRARAPKPKAAKKPKPPRSKNLLVVGLGNPGDEYRHTRHNAGYLVADALARRHGGTLKVNSNFKGEYCSANIGGKSVGILRPTTYMNKSGESLRKVLAYYKLAPASVLVLVDEVALDFGQLRLRNKGGAGGHNGLKSLQSHLGTQEYARLRIGVGAPRNNLVEHVLGKFNRSELKDMDGVIMDACEVVEHWLEEDDDQKVMSRCNAA